MVENYLRRLSLDRPRYYVGQVRSWTRHRAVRVGNTPLYFHYEDGARAVDEQHQPVQGHKTDRVSIDLLRVNHYFTRSQLERERKLQQRNPYDGRPRNPAGVEERDRRLNEEYDDTILASLKALRARS